MEEFNFKNFEEVRLIATNDMKVGNRSIEAGETIVVFDNISIAGLSEMVSRHVASGGYHNASLIYWDSVSEQNLSFSQGTFSKEQFVFLTNCSLIEPTTATPILVPKREVLETNASGKCTLSQVPQDLYVYDSETGEKLAYALSNKELTLSSPYLTIIADYHYNYSEDYIVYKFGDLFSQGFISLEGKTRVKDDNTGDIVTGFIRIPKLKLMSGLSIRLGQTATPMVGKFSGVALPVGARGNSYISEFYILSDDIDSDI